MRTYFPSVEKTKGVELRKEINGFVDWYKKQYEDYHKLIQLQMAENLFYDKFISINNKKDNIINQILSSYDIAFDTVLTPFCVAEILCKHLLSTFSFGPENVGNITGFDSKIRYDWFKYKGDIAFSTQILQDYFNQNNVGGDIDLNVLLEERRIRSRLVHSGSFELCMSLIRLYNVIRRMLIFMNDDYKPELAEFLYPDNITFAFQELWGHFGFNDFKNKTTVLIVGSLHDIDQSRLELLANFPWNIVIDFDGNTKFDGLRSKVDSQSETIVHDRLLNISVANGIAITEGLTEWLNCGEFLLPNPNEKLANTFGGMTAFYTQKSESKYPYYDFVVENILKPIFQKIQAKQNSVSILYFYHDIDLLEETIKLCEKQLGGFYSLAAIYYWSKDDCQDVCKNGYLKKGISNYADRFAIFSCNLDKFFDKLDEYKDSLPKKIVRNNPEKELPTENGYEVLPINLQTRLHKYFEVLYTNVGEEEPNVAQESIRKFYRGELVPWCAFVTGSVVKLIDDDEYKWWIQRIKTLLGRIPNVNSDKILYLNHEPGIGGTTMLRQIGWDLHKDYPVYIANRYEKSETKKILNDVYTLHSKKGFVVLVDEQYDAVEDLKEDIKALSLPCVMIIAKRTKEERTKVDSKNGKNKNIFPLNVITNTAAKKLKQLFWAESPLPYDVKAEKNNHYEDFINQSLQTRSPFFIGLYYIERDFKHLNDYIKRVLLNINSNNEVKALGYIAMCDFYGKVELPAIFIDKIVSINSRRVNWIKYTNNDLNSVIYYGKNTNGTNCYISKHYLISEELFKQCSWKLYNSSYKDTLDLWAKSFINDIFKECEDYYTETYKVILETLFTQNRVGGAEDFSKFILDIPVSIKRVEILTQIVEKSKLLASQNESEKEPSIYMMAAHFYGHLGRLYSKASSEINNYEKAIECSGESLHYLELCNQIKQDKQELHEPAIYHMHGETLRLYFKQRCSEKLNDKLSISKDDYLNFEGEIQNIRRYYNLAASAGERSQIIAMSSTIRLLIDYLIFVYRAKGIKDINDLRLLTNEQHLLRMEVEEIIYSFDLEVLNENDTDYNTFKNLVYEYESGIMFDDYSKTKEYFDNRYRELLKNSGNLEEIVSVRQHLINSIVAICRVKTSTGKIYYDYSLLPQKDVDRTLDLLQELFDRKINDEDNYYERKSRCNAYNRWMNIAKYSTRSIEKGIGYASEWKELVLKDFIKDPKPFYYLYVLYYLSVLDGNMNNIKCVEDFKELSYNYSKNRGKGAEYVRDILVKGNGMGQLCDANVIEDWKTIKLKRNIQMQPFEGKLDNVESKKGWVTLVQPARWLGNKAKFETGKYNTMSKDALTHQVRFYGGFSYETIAAIDSSVRDITTGEVMIVPTVPATINKPVAKPQKNNTKHIKNTRFINDTKSEKGNTLVDFFPFAIRPHPYRPEVVYLNGNLPNDSKGGLSSEDIDSFGDSCEKYGGSKAIIELLRKRTSFKVIVKNDNDPDRCSVSLYKTGFSLDDIMGDSFLSSNLTTIEHKKIIDCSSVKGTEASIVDAIIAGPKIKIGTPVVLKNCDFSKRKSISGEFNYEGKWYKGIITNLSPKKKKEYEKEYEGKKNIQAKVKGYDNTQHILSR